MKKLVVYSLLLLSQVVLVPLAVIGGLHLYSLQVTPVSVDTPEVVYELRAGSGASWEMIMDATTTLNCLQPGETVKLVQYQDVPVFIARPAAASHSFCCRLPDLEILQSRDHAPPATVMTPSQQLAVR